MVQSNNAWLEHERRRLMRPDAHRFVRPDAWRFMPPGAPRWYGKDAVRYFWPCAETSRRANTSGSNSARLCGVAQAEPAGQRLTVAKLRLEWALLRFALAGRKAGFNPSQPRVPSGQAEGGQWTGGGSENWRDAFASAGMPRIPGQRPPTGPERTGIAKELALWLAEAGSAALDVIAKTSWLVPLIPNIVSYFDAPRTLAELQDGVLSPKAGYDIHHVVERASAKESGYSTRRIEAPENRVRIPRMKHWEINGWYQRSNEDFGGASPRDYLRHKDWGERERIGLDALRLHGVLKP